MPQVVAVDSGLAGDIAIGAKADGPAIDGLLELRRDPCLALGVNLMGKPIRVQSQPKQ